MALIQSLQHPNETTMTTIEKQHYQESMMSEEMTSIDYVMEAASRSHFSSFFTFIDTSIHSLIPHHPLTRFHFNSNKL